MNTRKSVLASCALAATLTASGCSSAREQAAPDVARADLAIQRASSADGQQHAPLEMRTAREKLDRARKAAAEGDGREASFLADEAEVDARLAEAKAEAATAQKAATDTRRTVDMLQGSATPGARP